MGSLLLLPSCSVKDGEKNPPNIVFILADDLGYGDISSFNPLSGIKTPNIDRIATSGIKFNDAHSGSAVSTPTRYGILTGRYTWRTELKQGVLDGYSKALIKPDRKTLPQILKDVGYQTACIGKWHLGWDWNNIEKGSDSIRYSKPITNGPTTRGFDYFYGISGSLDMPPYVYVENDRPTALPDRLTSGNNIPVGNPEYDGSFWREGPTGSDFDHQDCTPNFVRRACRYITEKSVSEKPYFLYLALPSPHTPILPSEKFKGVSGLNYYADFVMMIDSMAGMIMKAVDESGEKENTILIFASDNGTAPWADIETLKKKGHNPTSIYRGHKADIYDGGHRIPCLMRWPAKIKKPFEVSQTVCLNDFMATFAEITGYTLKDTEGEDSFSLLPVILNPGYNKMIHEATVHHSVFGHFAIRQGHWKLLLTPGSGGWSSPKPGKESEGLPPVQLYNMKDDPGETVTLQKMHPDKVKELTSLLKKYIEEGRSTKGTPQQNDGDYPWKEIEGFFN